MHAVALSETSVTVVPGGPGQTIVATITDVPADTSVVQVLEFFVGSTPVSANLTVNVDHPSPAVSADPASPAYTIQAATPVQDPDTPTTWTCEITIAAV